MDSRTLSAQSRSKVTLILGALLLMSSIGVFVFAPATLPEYKQRILALASALLCGLSAHFLTGHIKVENKPIKATGGVAVFAVVLWWWLSPWAPVSVTDQLYRVRVTVLDQQQVPVEDARVWSSIGGEPKKVAGGWQLDIPAASTPKNGKLTIYASKETTFLVGQYDVQLEAEENPAITIQLKRDPSASIRGMILDSSGRGLAGVRVSIAGYEKETTITTATGNFTLSAHAAYEQQVLLHVEKERYTPENQWHPAGDEPVMIVLERE
ncbi:MAG: carboxypeptidase-like regulatory domain-containing protein [bacterium]|uniref:Carboxypeptidase-like regulatory domain-containing protein n=1 Tax=Candidatus Methylomirabilis tolerans TaxID=3123416 RepID=A0AAJ1AHZ5_9BACT|nr:carboxypeptidase-like regulatory domain-containing protein [Candidatus Methylomirabilis sp.]